MSKPLVFRSLPEFANWRSHLPDALKTGFVPTMGALHEGHARLLKTCSLENDITVLSIFVNPTQFNNPEDLKKYPKTWEQDVLTAENNGVTAILAPEYGDMYPDNYRFNIHENNFSKILCGAHRPGHFDGVLTVVMKLFQIVRPQKAYFGEKDFQQLQLIRDMATALFLPLQIIPCPTVREHDGLAMSSRNVRLTAEGREKAPALYRALTQYKDPAQARAFLQSLGIQVEYLEEHFNRRFIAAFIDGVRLIDNVEI